MAETTLKLINIANSEVLVEESFSESEIGEAQHRWGLQIDLYKMDGIDARLEIIRPEPEPEEE